MGSAKVIQSIFKTNYKSYERRIYTESSELLKIYQTQEKELDAPYVINFSSNDYLGLSMNTFLLKKLKNLHTSRISQCSSRLISGNTESLENLEKALSKHRRTTSTLLFPTGFMANLGVLGCISDKDTIIFSDELNHASIIDGCKMSPSKIHPFPHNDIIELEKNIKKHDNKRKIIITEGIFSMDGDMSELTNIVAFQTKIIAYS